MAQGEGGCSSSRTSRPSRPSVAARLRAEGFRSTWRTTGPSAVAAAAPWQPDLVVLDVMLPGFDGLEVCRRLHARPPGARC